MKSTKRLKILDKIKEYEANGWWEKDVEDDPETITLLPNKIDYLNKKLSNKVINKIANHLAISYYEKLIKQNKFIIKEVKGLENYKAIASTGAILTCNHFHPYDNYAVFRAIRKDLGKHNLYKVIREGNYTNFKGFYGFLFRHCNTLPLSSNKDTMKKFLKSIEILLKNNEKVLIYPEQSMWWNYRKPKPMQNGAFKLAVMNNVPIVPFFITMEDTVNLDDEGFPIQAYTINIMPAIYKDEKLNNKENVELMKNLNYEICKRVYEDFYKIPLTY